jgi:hypothetical protein
MKILPALSVTGSRERNREAAVSCGETGIRKFATSGETIHAQPSFFDANISEKV